MSTNTPVAFSDFTSADMRNLETVRQKLNANFRILQRALQGIAGTLQSSATPSMAGATVWTTNNTSATSITTFKGGKAGDRFVLIAGDANTTLKNGSTLVMAGGADVSLTNGQVKDFVTTDGTTWREVP